MRVVIFCCQFAPQNFGRVGLVENLRFEIEPRRKTEVTVRWPCEAVDAAMLAAAIGVNRAHAGEVGRLDVIDDAAAGVDMQRGFQFGKFVIIVSRSARSSHPSSTAFEAKRSNRPAGLPTAPRPFVTVLGSPSAMNPYSIAVRTKQEQKYSMHLSRRIHSLMQNTDDMHDFFFTTIDNCIRTDIINAIAIGYNVACMSRFGMQANNLESPFKGGFIFTRLRHTPRHRPCSERWRSCLRWLRGLA